MKYLYLLMFLFTVSCADEVLGDCYVSPTPNTVCTEESQPVCACNDIVYSNSCEAEKAGNLKWKPTRKEKSETCSY